MVRLAPPARTCQERILGVVASLATPFGERFCRRSDCVCLWFQHELHRATSCVAQTARRRHQRRREQMTTPTECNDSRGIVAGRATRAVRGRGRPAPPPQRIRQDRPLDYALPLKSATASSRPARRIRTSARNTRPAAKAMPKPRTSQDSSTKIIAMAARTGTSSVNA